MNDDDRLNQYFHLRASTLTIEPADSATVVARAGRRRRSRRTLGVVAATAVVLVGALAVFGGGTTTRELNAAGSTSAQSSLDWTAVDVPEGLGWSSGTVAADDGSIYGLSTAPGPADPTNEGGRSPSVLYHSTDGQNWEALELPGDLAASELATADGRLYAVGTAPGGGGVDLVVASSTDGAETWSEARIPSPAASLKARFPTEVHLSPPMITSGPEGMIAAVTVTATPDVAARLGLDQQARNAGYSFTTDGVDLFAPPNPDGTCGSEAPVPTSTTTTVPGEVVAPDTSPAPCGPPAIARSYTWAELGLEPELEALRDGSTHLYRSTDGSTFDEVTPSGVPAGRVAALIGGDDDYRLLVSDPQTSTLHPLWSADGSTWTQTGNEVVGYVQSAGLLAGRPAIVVVTEQGASLLSSTVGGGWSSSDLLAAAGIAPIEGKPLDLADTVIGPLGLVAVASNGFPADTVIIDSANGLDFARHTVSDLADSDDWLVAGLIMNADAVIVRMVPESVTAADGTTTPTPGPQRLLVGTPG